MEIQPLDQIRQEVDEMKRKLSQLEQLLERMAWQEETKELFEGLHGNELEAVSTRIQGRLDVPKQDSQRQVAS